MHVPLDPITASPMSVQDTHTTQQMINTNIAENNYSQDDQAYLLSFNAIPPFPLSLSEFLLSE